VTIHDLTISRFATGRATTKPYPVYLTKRLGYNFVLSKAIANAAKIITASKAVAEQIKKEYPQAKDKVVVTYESGELEAGGKTKPLLNKPYLLYVGNAHPHKNLDTLLAAFRLVQQKLPATHLVLVGRLDFFYQRLEKQIKESSYAQNVLLTGEIANEQLIQWYNGARSFVFPSQAEGFGIPGLEAMRLGCPVVCSDIAVFREIYGKAALFFDQNDPRDMADEVVSILTKSSLRNMLVKLGKEQAHKFSWEKMARETKAVYESCAGLRSHQ
jgi:glycosyltransferase involved in cell wall biosynthesis